MLGEKYQKRIIEEELKKKLKYSGAVLIEGPKWVGKTSTGIQFSKSQLFLQDAVRGPAYKDIAYTEPAELLKGDNPRLIDEWQDAPILWDAARHLIDFSNERGLYIFTGSSVPKDGITKHSGAGRFSKLVMRPMSLYESLDSSGEVSLKDLFENHDLKIFAESKLNIEKISKLVFRGGWPFLLDKDEEEITTTLRDYIRIIINQDIDRVDGVEKNPDRVLALLRSYSRNISTLASLQTILDDFPIDEITTVSDTTARQYINALRRIFIIDDVDAWMPSLRSKTAIRSGRKRQLVDPSLACAVMGINPKSILEDFCYFGFLFESLCFRDIRVYADAIEGKVFHYRDKSNLEADIIIELFDGRWAALEVKLGSKQIEEAATNLLKLKEKVNTEKMKEPSFLAVICGNGFAYRRKDGVYVIPIDCLKN